MLGMGSPATGNGGSRQVPGFHRPGFKYSLLQGYMTAEVGPKAQCTENQDLRVLSKQGVSDSSGPGPSTEQALWKPPYLTEVGNLPLHVLVWHSLGLHFGLHDTEGFLQALRFPEGLGGGQSGVKTPGNFQLCYSVCRQLWPTLMKGYGTTHQKFPQDTRSFPSFREPLSPNKSTSPCAWPAERPQ